MRKFRKAFLSGLVIVIPLFITVFIIWFLISKVGGLLEKYFQKLPYLQNLPEFVIQLIGLFAVIFAIYLIGLFASTYIGRRIINVFDNFLLNIPLLKPIYESAKKLTNAIFVDRSAFKEVVFLEYPRKGIYTIGFVTSEKGIHVDGKNECISVFVPTSPNPTSGFYIAVPKEQIIKTDFTIDEAFRLIVSGGIILPERKNVGKIIKKDKIAKRFGKRNN